MAFCNECGAEIPLNNKFCSECGKPVPELNSPEEQAQPSGPPPAVIPPAPASAVPIAATATTQAINSGQQPAPGASDASVFPAIQPELSGGAPPAPVPPPVVNNIQPQPANAGFAGSTSQPSAPRPVNTYPQQVNTYPQAVNTSAQNVISVGGYVGTLILFSIPIIGWIICIIMAIVAKNPNRRNFARAMLILIIIMIVISVIFYFILGWIWEVILEYAQGYVEGVTGGLFSDFGGFGDLFDVAD